MGKLKELNSKVQEQVKSYNLEFTYNSKEFPWTIKVCEKFSTIERKLSKMWGIMIFFSLASKESFDYASEILDQYLPISTQYRNHTLLLVGTHHDSEHEVSSSDIKELVNKHSICYFPCSSQNNFNIQHMFMYFISQLIFQIIHYPRWLTVRSSLKDKLATAVTSRNTARIKQLLATNTRSLSELLKCDWSLIHIAAWEGFFECVFLFLQYDPTCINATNSANWTPLHIASRMGHFYVVEY